MIIYTRGFIRHGFRHGSGRLDTIQPPLTATEIADGSITTPKLADGAVTNIKLSAERLPLSKLPDGPIGLVLTARGVGLNPVYEPARGDYPQKLRPAIPGWGGPWVRPGWFTSDSWDNMVHSGVIYYTPIFVEEATIYIRIGITVTTGAVGTADLRIFNWRNGIPHSLILSAGTVSTETPGGKEIIISQRLDRGYYFLANRCTSTPILRGVDPTKGIKTPVSGMNWSLGDPGSERFIILTATAAYADPAPAPTGITTPIFANVLLRES
ncbi:MAG: hypothetical protein DDT23_01366 [candidate division WS2 bacterium]|nr:hypothetical protein [Candidatus Lithacetigena glycinireducens]